MERNSKWENKYAVETAFDNLNMSSDEVIDVIREKIELRNKFLKRAELKPMAKIRTDEDSHGTSRAQHMRHAAEISKKIAHKLGLNEIVAYAGMLGHDAGHSFFGHEGEHTMNVIGGKLLKVGYFHHNAKGIDVILSENLIEKIVDSIPEAKNDKELRKRLEEDAWYFLDVVVSHDGEATSKENIISDKDKEENRTIKEIVLDKVKKSNRENLYKCEPETLEAIISRPADVISYIKTDMIDAFSEGIIVKLDDEYFETIGAILCEETEERNQNLVRQDVEALKKERIEKAQKLILEYKKKHLSELREDLDIEKMEIAESVLEKVQKERINIFSVYTKDQMEKDVAELKKDLKDQDLSTLEQIKIVEQAKREFIVKYKDAMEAEKRVNQILTSTLESYRNKRLEDGMDSNTIASEVNKIEEYVQKLTKDRKRVIEDIMNDIQEAMIDDYVKTTKGNWQDKDDYDELKRGMKFSKGMERLLFNKLKAMNYEKYVQYTKKIYQENSVPVAVLSTVQDCAKALVKTGIIRDKFYDATVLSKIENDEVKEHMRVPERNEEEYQEFKKSIGAYTGIKIIRNKKKNKKIKYTGLNTKRNIYKKKLYKEIYAYTQRQGTRFAMNCEDVYYAIEPTISNNVKDAFSNNFKPEKYLCEEQLAEMEKIRGEVKRIYKGLVGDRILSRETEKEYLEEAKKKYIIETTSKEKENFEEKVASEIVIRYLAGMTDKKIIKTLLKTGNLSWFKYKKEDKINEEGNEVIKGLIESHKEQPEEMCK